MVDLNINDPRTKSAGVLDDTLGPEIIQAFFRGESTKERAGAFGSYRWHSYRSRKCGRISVAAFQEVKTEWRLAAERVGDD